LQAKGSPHASVAGVLILGDVLPLLPKLVEAQEGFLVLDFRLR
jgi:hypothetical protein